MLKYIFNIVVVVVVLLYDFAAVGVNQLQDDYDHRKTKRMDTKLRKSDVLACLF